MRYDFYHSCVNWPEDVHRTNGLCDMINDAINITRRTFLKYINRKELQDLESQLGYFDHSKKGLTMASDWHVSYHRSYLHNKRVYYFCQSGIEYVFKQRKEN